MTIYIARLCVGADSEADFQGVTDGLAGSAAPMEREVSALMRATRAVSSEPEGN